jgi:hypothetical protein
VSQQAVERTRGKLLTDETFRDRFFRVPKRASWGAGLQLSETELDALSHLSSSAVAQLGRSLDPRIRRLCVTHPTAAREARS